MIFLRPAFIKDTVFVILLTIAFYFVESKMPLPTWNVILGLVLILMHPLSLLVLDLYSYYIFGIGYDKWFHLSSAIVMTLTFYSWLSKKLRPASAILISILMALGIGSLNEIIEFIGTTYIHINSSSMFSQGDSLPYSISDLQVYDTWWDMIFNLFGTVAGAIIILATGLGYRKDHDVKSRGKA